MVEHIWEDRKITHRFFGQTSSLEVKRAIIKHQSDWRFDDLSEVICDFTSCTSVTIYPGDIEEIAAMDGAAAKSNPRIRITVIADNPEITEATQTYINCRLSSYPLKVIAPATAQNTASSGEFSPRKTAFSY